MKEYALITGASKGIGKSISQSLAQMGYNVLLVARSETDLKQLSESISVNDKVEVQYLPIDLSTDGAAKKVADWCKKLSVPITILVNNAGYGLWGKFEDIDLAEQLNMLKLNMDTVVALTYYLLPLLKEQKQSYILYVSSTAAYQAVPTLGLYSASKSFILSFSRALRYELKGTPVSVSCLCPGPTDTGFTKRAGMADLAEKFNMSPKIVAEAGLKAMFNKKAEVIPGFLNRLSAFGARYAPKTLVERISAGLYER
jgi:uncharacterized protein